MTAVPDNSQSTNRQLRNQAAADYVYQGATIIAALLLLLSATV